jgi:acylglycerol lipase
MSVIAERIDSTGGVKIHLRSWKPAGRPKAIVVICHGFNSHGGLYVWAAEQLVADGYSVYVLDLRGRGRSDGPRFYVDTMADYVGDVATVVRLARTREPGLPLFLLGHSAGGVISVTYALDHQAELAGLICESFAYRVPAPGIVLSVLKGMSALAPRLGVFKLKNKDFSRDPAIVALLDADPLIASENQPAATVAALVRASERLKREFGRITLPVFILHGTMDKVTVPAGSEEFAAAAGSKDKTLKLYPGHFHDLLADVGREGVMADIKAWLGARLAVAAA